MVPSAAREAISVVLLNCGARMSFVRTTTFAGGSSVVPPGSPGGSPTSSTALTANWYVV